MWHSHLTLVNPVVCLGQHRMPGVDQRTSRRELEWLHGSLSLTASVGQRDTAIRTLFESPRGLTHWSRSYSLEIGGRAPAPTGLPSNSPLELARTPKLMSSRRIRPRRLRDLRGVGEARAKSLEEAGFQTIEDVHAASRDDLQTVRGIGGSMATRIKQDVSQVVEGDVFDSGTDAAEEIDAKHEELGGSNGRLGRAIGDVEVNDDGFGRRRQFEHGRIYWSRPTGAHAVFHGPVSDQWMNLGAERAEPDSLRYPAGEEQETTEGDGRLQHFQGGAIFWTHTSGPIVVRDLPWAPPKPVLFKHRLLRQGSDQRRLIVEQSFDDLGLVNAKDKATSLYIPEGWVVSIFDKPKYLDEDGGRRLRGPIFVERLHGLKRRGGKNWNDAIASLHVHQRGPEAEEGYRAEPPHGELVIRWAGIVSNGEGPKGDKIGITGHGPIGNFHVLIYEEDVEPQTVSLPTGVFPGFKNLPTRMKVPDKKALRHVVLPGPTQGEWDDGDQMFYGADAVRRPSPQPFEEGPLAFFRWRHPDDVVSVVVYESDPNPLDSHDLIFFARVRRDETLNGPRRYTGGTVNDPKVLERARERGAEEKWLSDTEFEELVEGMPNMFADLETVDRADRYFDKEDNTDWSHRQTFEFPMYGGYALDWCLKRGKECGQPAAEMWARKMFLNFESTETLHGASFGKDQVLEIEKDENVGLTKIIGSDELCTSPGCDGFAHITMG